MSSYRFNIFFWFLLILAAGLAIWHLSLKQEQSTPLMLSSTSTILSENNSLETKITNNSPYTDVNTIVYYYSLGQLVDKFDLGILSAGQEHKRKIDLPEDIVSRKASIVVKVSVSAKKQSLTLTSVVHWTPESTTSFNCPDPNFLLTSARSLNITHSSMQYVELHLPDSIKSKVKKAFNDGSSFLLTNLISDRNINQDGLILVRERQSQLQEKIAVCPLNISSKGIMRISAALPVDPIRIFMLAIVGLLIAIVTYNSSIKTGKVLSRLQIALIRWSFSIFIICTIYTFYIALPQISHAIIWNLEVYRHSLPEDYLKYIHISNQWNLLDRLIRAINFFKFSGKDYDYFNAIFAQPLLMYMLSLNFLVLYFFIKPTPKEDKYWQLFLKVYSAIPKFRISSGQNYIQTEDRLVKIAILALCVKIFFLPVFLSWTIINYYHLTGSWPNLKGNFFAINQLAIDILITIDVLIFTIGYLIEMPKMKNQIRSVDPTLFGWLICIICYPPINTWIFTLVDYPLNSSWHGLPEEYAMPVMVVITLLWVIYVWATVALGFKASNLTNRGIIFHGPYRYIRHPAYISKLLIWTISGVLLAQYSFFIVLSFWIVYWLRAITEERHLSADPDYVRYKEKVKWRFFPGLY
jgi:protein-S-isoprenylcysteine O-methyltransferase Ste14